MVMRNEGSGVVRALTRSRATNQPGRPKLILAFAQI
jgi:hypothetical protein